MYKIAHDLAPRQLINMFQKAPSSQRYNLRGSTTKLNLPKPKTEYLKKSLSYRGAKLWNSPPRRIKKSAIFQAIQFKCKEPGQAQLVNFASRYITLVTYRKLCQSYVSL